MAAMDVQSGNARSEIVKFLSFVLGAMFLAGAPLLAYLDYSTNRPLAATIAMTIAIAWNGWMFLSHALGWHSPLRRRPAVATETGTDHDAKS